MSTEYRAMLVIGREGSNEELLELDEDLEKFGDCYSGDYYAVGYRLQTSYDSVVVDLTKQKELEDKFYKITGEAPELLLVLDVL